MVPMEPLSASQEDYLEVIFHIVAEKQAARAKDIARRMAVNNSSVTGALRILAEKGYINYAPYDLVTLTPEGLTHARDIARRHEVLCDFFVKVLGIEETEADDTACKMEHALSANILNRLISFVEFIETCPRGADAWVRRFREHCGGAGAAKRSDAVVCGCLQDLEKRRKQLGPPQPPRSLRDLRPGQKGTLVKITGRGGINTRMADLGIKTGSLFAVENVDPQDEAVSVKVRAYHLTLRQEEAEKIVVKVC